MNRLYNLDYLRGLAAFGIMIYHYLIWTVDEFSADTFMGRFGIYGVSIFYVLSGLTLYHVYGNRMNPSKQEVILFFKKRIFRIFPLLWLVTIVAIILFKKSPNLYDLLLNLTGLFGFIKWDKYFSPGVWSIGNELVFYVFFPFFILFIKKFKPFMLALTIFLLGCYLYFAFVKLNPQLTLSQQWKNYLNPLNQVFLFLGGFLIGFFFHQTKIKNTIIFALTILAFTAFTFYPASGNTINLVTGTNRLVFTFFCFLICFCFYKLTFKFPTFIHQPLTILGETSYSVYLLHPIVWILTGYANGVFSKYNFHAPARLMLSVFLTLIISYYVYQYFEKYFIKLGQTNKSNPAELPLYKS
ncbi:acyltransferase family protein [Pedobacter glucosidilyticus]|uniref:acyltransferase family protein n=1 Tax=Pedobacter glucosidilyticus TaxID=1122941 RepID=UPI00047C0D48|nr:acyltransferase [Pedobacter glucosidilyticus]